MCESTRTGVAAPDTSLLGSREWWRRNSGLWWRREEPSRDPTSDPTSPARPRRSDSAASRDSPAATAPAADAGRDDMRASALADWLDAGPRSALSSGVGPTLSTCCDAEPSRRSRPPAAAGLLVAVLPAPLLTPSCSTGLLWGPWLAPLLTRDHSSLLAEVPALVRCGTPLGEAVIPPTPCAMAPGDAVLVRTTGPGRPRHPCDSHRCSPCGTLPTAAGTCPPVVSVPPAASTSSSLRSRSAASGAQGALLRWFDSLVPSNGPEECRPGDGCPARGDPRSSSEPSPAPMPALPPRLEGLL